MISRVTKTIKLLIFQCLNLKDLNLNKRVCREFHDNLLQNTIAWKYVTWLDSLGLSRCLNPKQNPTFVWKLVCGFIHDIEFAKYPNLRYLNLANSNCRIDLQQFANLNPLLTSKLIGLELPCDDFIVNRCQFEQLQKLKINYISEFNSIQQWLQCCPKLQKLTLGLESLPTEHTFANSPEQKGPELRELDILFFSLTFDGFKFVTTTALHFRGVFFRPGLCRYFISKQRRDQVTSIVFECDHGNLKELGSLFPNLQEIRFSYVYKRHLKLIQFINDNVMPVKTWKQITDLTLVLYKY